MHPPINSSFLNRAVCECAVWGGIGYVIGRIAETSPNACGMTLLISSIAKTIFSIGLGYVTTNPVHYEAMCSLSTFLTEIIAILFMKHNKWITSDGAYVLTGPVFIKAMLLR